MSQSREDTGWSWSIGVVAAGLLIMAVIEFVRPRSGETVDLSGGIPAAETSDGMHLGSGTPELYRILPDASADLGRTVQVAGTIIGHPSGEGFWVRDLRDNIIFIADRALTPGDQGAARPGRAVRVRGVIALFPRAEQEAEFRAAGLVLPAGANVVREVKVTALDGGIEVLRD